MQDVADHRNKCSLPSSCAYILMTFLPIVERELRVAARRRGTYWIRVGAALAGLAIGCWVMLFPDLRTPQKLGIVLFVALSVVAFIYSLLAGVLATADCLSEEKREGTLGLLFLTDLKGYDIVVGKLAATSLHAFYGMLAIFPVMAISLLVGGVTGSEFWRVVLVCLNNLFFSLAIGMFCSALSRDGWKASVLAIGIVLALVGGLPLVGGLVTEWKRLARPPPIFFIPSPGYSCFLAFDQTFKALGVGKFNFFYWSVLCVNLMGWTLLLFACLLVPRTWRDKASRQSSPRAKALNRSGGEWALRAQRLEENPFYWLAGRDRRKAIYVWVFLAVIGLIWIWGLAAYGRDWRNQGMFVLTAIVCHSVLKLWVASEAARRFAEDRPNGALELLLSTPVTVKEILAGQLLALWKQFAGPVGLVVLADLFFLFSHRAEESWVVVCVAGISMFIVDLIALSWVGMWMGLTSRNLNRAAFAAATRILVVPWLLFAVLMTLEEVTRFFREVDSSPPWWRQHFPVLAWLFIGFLVSGIFGWRAHYRLSNHFRTVATQRFETRRARLPESKV